MMLDKDFERELRKLYYNCGKEKAQERALELIQEWYKYNAHGASDELVIYPYCRYDGTPEVKIYHRLCGGHYPGDFEVIFDQQFVIEHFALGDLIERTPPGYMISISREGVQISQRKGAIWNGIIPDSVVVWEERF